MSFGLGISFGRLCKKARTLEDIYEQATRIEWVTLYENENVWVRKNLRSNWIISIPKNLMINIISE